MKITEKDIIDIISKNTNFREEVLVPIGDDASVLLPKQNSYLVLTTDTMVLDTHFDSNITPYELGYIAAASNVSDLSAMGAKPAFALLNLTLPETSGSYIKELIKGCNKVFKEFPVSVIGGDTTNGPLSITFTLIGYTEKNNFMKIDNAKPEDKIFISGLIGESLLSRKNNKYHLPKLRNELGILLTNYANCCTDMSDGLLASLNNITKQSNLGSKIIINNIPISKNLKKKLEIENLTWQDILSYGEDYELLFSVSRFKTEVLTKLCRDINFDIYEIGKFTEEKKSSFYNDDIRIELDMTKKFEHF
ncbi:MAG: thiamine-phosphate kinase [Gammaproteobacteria bacterium]|jgi:thiamine-monophosphate kinase|nr:thiamine-phosphate kinase [Gammaproteobacteria bacterium]MBT7603361.1 thiamine-phosphate kinase [Gammaproteobacteria bacterium]